MITFDMTLNEHYKSFKLGDNLHLFVESFDNKEFHLRVGTFIETVSWGSIQAMTDAELNEKLAKRFAAGAPYPAPASVRQSFMV